MMFLTQQRQSWQETLLLGSLLGMVEAVAIVTWDWVPLQEGSVVGGAIWALAIFAISCAAWVVLEQLCRRNRLAAVMLFMVALNVARWWSGDRFAPNFLLDDIPAPKGLLLLIAALLLTHRRLDKLTGVLAVVLATPALMGRVPNYTAPITTSLLVWLPVAVVATVIGALPRRRWQLLMPPFAVVAIIATVGFVRHTERPAGTGPNILFVMVDTLRRDHIAPYARDAHSPTFERIAREGVLFDDAVTVIPKTPPSVAAFFTGRYPNTSGVRTLRSAIPDGEVTLAELLRSRGYATAAFVHNGLIMRGRGFEQGFEQFWSWFEIESPWGPPRYSSFVTMLDAFFFRRIDAFDRNTDARVVTDVALEWLRKDRSRPFFAYVHYLDPHWPYRPAGEDGECLVNNIQQVMPRGRMIFQNDLPAQENDRARFLYRKEVEYTDLQIGRLTDWLDEAGLAEETLVIYTADHGHHLGDHDYHFHHGEFLYESGVRIPLALRWPNRLPAGKVVRYQARSIDVAPMLTELIGVPGLPADGSDALAGPVGAAFLESDVSRFKRHNHRRFMGGVLGKVRGVRTDRWKLIYTPRPEQGIWELYDLHADRPELDNVLEENLSPTGDLLFTLMHELRSELLPKEQKKLARRGNYFDSLPRLLDGEPSVQQTDEEDMSTIDQQLLRSMGYIQ